MPVMTQYATIFLILLPGLAAAATLREALDAAAVRAPPARGLEAGRIEAAAHRYAADRLFPGMPALGLGQREGEGGKREFELELSTPLWLPGQRQASLALADARIEENAAAYAARRWALAGELRNLLAAARAAKAEVDLARARLENDRQLADEVARRVAAGDLARADSLLARGELLASESAVLEADSRLTRALRDYRVLTGLAALPSDAVETLAPPPAGLATGLATGLANEVMQQHPALAAARRNVELARAGLELTRRTRRDAPELGVQVQTARDVSGADYQNSVRFGLRIPFSGEARNRPLLAAANGDLIRAEAELAQATAELENELQTAQAELANAERGEELAHARRQGATERLRLIRRGFELGELSLAQLLLARGQANEAEAATTRAGLSLAAARARLNQASGVLP
ncbi:MAG: TolC family protein [Pseudomonadota bacterium]|nr:TolC family protein [Pseudomonadota bacterium]